LKTYNYRVQLTIIIIFVLCNKTIRQYPLKPDSAVVCRTCTSTNIINSLFDNFSFLEPTIVEAA